MKNEKFLEILTNFLLRLNKKKKKKKKKKSKNSENVLFLHDSFPIISNDC